VAAVAVPSAASADVPAGDRWHAPVPPFHGDLTSADDHPGSDWQDIRLTARSIGHRLLHPTRKDGLTYAGLVLGALYLERKKFDLAGETQEQRSEETNDLSVRVRPMGEALVPLAALSTYFIGRMSGSESTRRAGLILSESAAFTVVATEIGQYLLSEQRPDEGGKLTFFSGGGHGVSGHTSIIASMSVPLDRMLFTIQPDDGGWARFGKYVGKAAVYAAPVATGWSRMNDNKHFAWNILLGLGTGYMMGEFVASAHGLNGRHSDERSWSVVPITDDHGAPGIAFRWAH